jgi:hypothetical protein
MARTEFGLASQLRPVKVSEFSSTDDLRRYLVTAFSQLRSASQRGVVADFSRLDFDEAGAFGRVGSGSMGGKGRGLGFVNAMLPQIEAGGVEEGVKILIPPSAVVGTDVFDDFIHDNHLSAIALSDAPDEEIASAFLNGRLRDPILEDLRIFVTRIRHPLAVRSSSLLEDSHEQPSRDHHPTCSRTIDDEATRCDQSRGDQLVYASTFFRNAKAIWPTRPTGWKRRRWRRSAKLVGRLYGRYWSRFLRRRMLVIYYPTRSEPEDGCRWSPRLREDRRTASGRFVSTGATPESSAIFPASPTS